MKTLDSVITRVLSNGEKQSVSSKCAEMDREVMASISVKLFMLYTFSVVNHTARSFSEFSDEYS